MFLTGTTLASKLQPKISKTQSMLNRTQIFDFLKNSLFMDTMNCIVSLFKIRDTSVMDGAETIYGFLYSEFNAKKVRDKSSSSNEDITRDISHTYCCVGPSLLSKDGEYRPRVVYIGNIHALKQKYPAIWDKLEEYILYRIEHSDWNLFTEYFYPRIEVEREAISHESTIVAGHYAIYLLMLNWFGSIFEIMMDFTTNHVNKLYIQVMKFNNKKLRKSDIDFVKDLIKQYTFQTVYKVYRLCSAVLSNDGDFTHRVGQKLMPLNLSEVQHPFNFQMRPWREFLICQRVQDLVVNKIASGFPIVGDYFYIKDQRKSLFDNYAQYMKLEHSEYAIMITRKLVDAQRGTYMQLPKSKKRQIMEKIIAKGETREKTMLDTGERHATLYKVSDSDGNDVVKELSAWLSDKFQELHDKIQDPIEYSKRDIIMSEVALGITMEYVGISFYDFLDMNLTSRDYSRATGGPFENYNYWAKYIFELTYNLLAMNTRLGLIHGDLHMNNFTVQSIDVDKLDSGHAAYVIDERVYAFETKQYFTSIIDFSRSIVHPKFIDGFVDANLSAVRKLTYSKNIYENGKIELFETEEAKADFHKEQVLRIMHIYEAFFPDFYEKNKLKLHILLLSKLGDLFWLLSAIDMHRVALLLIHYLKTNNLKKTKHIELIKQIQSICENHMTDKLLVVLENPSILDTDEYKVSVNQVIINSCFSEFICYDEKAQIDKLSDIINIIDVNVLNNPLEYSMREYDTFPPYLKHKDSSSRTNFEAKKYSNLEMVSYIAKRHKEKWF